MIYDFNFRLIIKPSKNKVPNIEGVIPKIVFDDE